MDSAPNPDARAAADPPEDPPRRANGGYGPSAANCWIGPWSGISSAEQGW